MTSTEADDAYYSYLPPTEAAFLFGISPATNARPSGRQYHVGGIFGQLWTGIGTGPFDASAGKPPYCWGNMTPDDLPVPLLVGRAAPPPRLTYQGADPSPPSSTWAPTRSVFRPGTVQGNVQRESTTFRIVGSDLTMVRPYLLVDLHGLEENTVQGDVRVITCVIYDDGNARCDRDSPLVTQVGNLLLIPTKRDAGYLTVVLELPMPGFQREDPAAFGVTAWATSRAIGQKILAARRDVIADGR